MDQLTQSIYSQLSQNSLPFNPQSMSYFECILLNQKMRSLAAELSSINNILKSKNLGSGLALCVLKNEKTEQTLPKEEFSPSEESNFYAEENLKFDLSPASNSTMGMTEERKDTSDNGEIADLPQLSECESQIKIEISEEARDEEPTKLMSQSKKIKKAKKEICSSSLRVNSDKTATQQEDKVVRRHRWNPEEDVQLAELHQKIGPKWTKIAALMNGRSPKQVRDRYTNILRPDIKHADWTVEEEKLFDSLYAKFGNKWCKIAAYLPGRTENQVKNKYYSQKKKEDSEDSLEFPVKEDVDVKSEYECYKSQTSEQFNNTYTKIEAL